MAEVKKLWGGTLPANWTTEADVTNLCAQVDAIIDGKTNPDVIGTGAKEAQLANDVVYRMMVHADWAHAGLEGEEPVIWNRDLLDRLNRLSTDASVGQAAYMKMMADS